MKKLILAVFVMLTISGEAWAIDAKGEYNILGQGNRSCGKWTQGRKKDDWPQRAAEAWILGFITAYNFYVPGLSNVAKGTDVVGREAWIDNYCRDHPLDKIVDATEALIKHLKTRQR